MLTQMTPSIEDYLSTIFRLDKGQGVRSVDVAKVLQVSKPSVNRALKTLSELKLVTQEPYGDIYLTPYGRETAIDLNKKYAILRGFLVHMLGVDPKQAELEAGQMEHGMSSDTIQKIGLLMRNYSRNKGKSKYKELLNKREEV